MSKKEEVYPGLIELPIMLPNGKTAIMDWPADMPLPKPFYLRPRPNEPGGYDMIIETEEA